MNCFLPAAITASRVGFNFSMRAVLEPDIGKFLFFSSILRSFVFMASSLWRRAVALLTSCGVRVTSLVGVCSLGVADLGVPGRLEVGEVTRLVQLEEAPLM